MENLKNILEDKTIKDFSREELEQLAKDNGVDFKPNTADKTILKNLKTLLLKEFENNGESTSVEKVKIKFLLSPSGKFLLPYSAGEVAEIETSLANELIESEYAEAV